MLKLHCSWVLTQVALYRLTVTYCCLLLRVDQLGTTALVASVGKSLRISHLFNKIQLISECSEPKFYLSFLFIHTNTSILLSTYQTILLPVTLFLFSSSLCSLFICPAQPLSLFVWTCQIVLSRLSVTLVCTYKRKTCKLYLSLSSLPLLPSVTFSSPVITLK